MRDLPSEVQLEASRLAVKSLLENKPRIGAKGTAELNAAILRWLERCPAVPPELVAAVARQLKVVRRRHNPGQDITNIAIALALDPDLKNKRLARARGVSLPTIARWKAYPHFEPIRAGFEALFARMTADEKRRAVRETSTEFPWLQKLFSAAKRRNT